MGEDLSIFAAEIGLDVSPFHLSTVHIKQKYKCIRQQVLLRALKQEKRRQDATKSVLLLWKEEND